MDGNDVTGCRRELPWIHYVIQHNKFQASNTHKFKQVVTEPISIKLEYTPLMCTKQEFEIKHA